MEMIAQTEHMDLPSGLRTGFAQRRQKQSAILLVDKNPLPLIASIHHVINRSLKLDPKRGRPLGQVSTDKKMSPSTFLSRVLLTAQDIFKAAFEPIISFS
jgi:hypothetical protein